ncbi:hypothetical protein SUNI508_09837 [Seiridium unicorne]|uniref:Uncharacterized protein n=1 Tax=Seiridium unicorne TaxID=138068 RepID=A0ABR2UNG5_9PEZI
MDPIQRPSFSSGLVALAQGSLGSTHSRGMTGGDVVSRPAPDIKKPLIAEDRVQGLLEWSALHNYTERRRTSPPKT